MKYFVVSDIHGFKTEFCKALTEKGFDRGNANHKLIVLGDCFDRGDENLEVLEWLEDLVLEDKAVVVRGNHEDLLIDCFKSTCFYENDFSNGTADTIADLAGQSEWRDNASLLNTYHDMLCGIAARQVMPFINLMVDYYETKNYIFVHGFIPMNKKMRGFSYTENWRNGDWAEARWLCGFDHRANNETGKTIVFGHWHTSYYNSPRYQYDFKKGNFNIAVCDHNCIGIDGCIALSDQANVLVIDDDEVV